MAQIILASVGHWAAHVAKEVVMIDKDKEMGAGTTNTALYYLDSETSKKSSSSPHSVV